MNQHASPLMNTLNETYLLALITGRAVTEVADMLVVMFTTPSGMVMKTGHFLTLNPAEFEDFIISEIIPF